MSALILAMPDLRARAARVAAAELRALLRAPEPAAGFVCGSLWRDLRSGAAVEVRGRTLGAGGRPIWLSVAPVGAPSDWPAALRVPSDLEPIGQGGP